MSNYAVVLLVLLALKQGEAFVLRGARYVPRTGMSVGGFLDRFSKNDGEGHKGVPAGSKQVVYETEELEDGTKVINKEHGLLGDVSVKFKQGNTITKTKAVQGQPISEVAADADVFIKYKCKKGECGTCSIMVDGKWIQACQTNVPQVAAGEAYEVFCREVNAKSRKSSGFFSPQSFVDGVVNNGLGVVGFVAEGAKAGDEFSVRMEREAKLAEIVARKKAEKDKVLRKIK